MILKRFNVERSEDDPVKIEQLKAEGYVPSKMCAALPPEPMPEKPDLRGMLKSELVELAQAEGIKGAKSLTKAELIEILEA